MHLILVRTIIGTLVILKNPQYNRSHFYLWNRGAWEVTAEVVLSCAVPNLDGFNSKPRAHFLLRSRLLRVLTLQTYPCSTLINYCFKIFSHRHSFLICLSFNTEGARQLCNEAVLYIYIWLVLLRCGRHKLILPVALVIILFFGIRLCDSGYVVQRTSLTKHWSDLQ